MTGTLTTRKLLQDSGVSWTLYGIPILS